jgi:predicted ATP-dependent endonuclease of OLD family
MMNLTRFQVVGLHGLRNIDVKLEDNKLILVGENGTGKSTFVNLIYYFLTKQWSRLNEYRFERIHAHFGDEELVIKPEHFAQHVAASRSLQNIMQFSRHVGASDPTAAITIYNKLFEAQLHEAEISDETLVARIAAEMRIPRAVAHSLVRDYRKETKGKPTHLQTLERILATTSLGQFLYLPTYRRIEQDLRSIFRGADIEAELRKFRDRLGRRGGSPFIELVEFGMEDVEQTIAARMAQIKESVRKGLDSLTGTYLRDVIRGVHTKVEVSQTDKIDSKALDAVFARIDEATLPTADKSHLKAKVAAISASHAIEEQDKVIAHFLLKLIELYSEQQDNEQNVRNFVSLCNQYLAGKQMVYDNAKYTIFIEQDVEGSKQEEDTLEMRTLSSGEKQIVSLFSHLYLSGQERFFVIIDEPELSLSVPWQRRFLPDILRTGMCSGLVSVTHSPFVWDNELEKYVRPLAEFSAPAGRSPSTEAASSAGGPR